MFFLLYIFFLVFILYFSFIAVRSQCVRIRFVFLIDNEMNFGLIYVKKHVAFFELFSKKLNFSRGVFYNKQAASSSKNQ